jgi:class 3 adenylate cyclase
MARHAWQESFDLFRAADDAGELSPQDLSAMSEVAFWSGQPVEAISAAQRAYAAYEEAGELTEAALVAATACRLNLHHGDISVAGGWLGRAQRLLADLPVCAGHGHLAWLEGQMMLTLNGNEQGLERAEQVVEIGKQIGDRDLVAMGISMQGFIKARTGDVAGGMRLIDEALAAAMAGELGALATAEIFCEMVVACLDATDFQRASEWLETADRTGQDLVCFPGCCRVHRATVLRHQGEWDTAALQASQACSELDGVEMLHEGMALCELGELYRNRGEHRLAERAFEQAHAKGWSPQPGLALVLLANGDNAAASRMIQSAVERFAEEPGTLLRLLPAQLEIAVACHDEAGAGAATARLEEIAAALNTTAARAASTYATGLLLQQQGDLLGATRHLEESVNLWQEAHNPFEAARSRIRLANVFEALGDTASANLELSSARKAFDRLGALPDARDAARRLGDRTPERASCTFMFTDIVDSTRLMTAIGDDSWRSLREWHDRTLGTLVDEYRGRVVKGTGDGFFAAFLDPVRAVECGVAIQRRLDEHRRSSGFAPSVRIGIHMGSAMTIDDDYAGKDVVVAARIGAIATSGQILISADLAERVPATIATEHSRLVSLKGIPGKISIAEVGWV